MLVDQLCRYTPDNGYKHKAVVIYGDTDSVMINFGLSNLEEVCFAMYIDHLILRLFNKCLSYVVVTPSLHFYPLVPIFPCTLLP